MIGPMRRLQTKCVVFRSPRPLLAASSVPRPRHRPLLVHNGARNRPLDTEEIWEALSLSKRELQVAISEEDYKLAAVLRDKVQKMVEKLPPRKRLLLSMLDHLLQPDYEDKAGALRVIGELGDSDALPQLSLCLANPALQQGTEAAMWRIFMHSDNLRVQMLMKEACTMLQRPGDWETCAKMFSSIIEEDPLYAEGYNKRATVLFLLNRYRESIEDCRTVLNLNPYHFAAASGMGMCYSRIEEYENAVRAFETALAIHPGLTELRRQCAELKSLIRKQQ